MSTDEPELTLDPSSWEDLRAHGHRVLDELLGWLEQVRSRPAWQPIPEAVRDALRAPAQVKEETDERPLHRERHTEQDHDSELRPVDERGLLGAEADGAGEDRRTCDDHGECRHEEDTAHVGQGFSPRLDTFERLFQILEQVADGDPLTWRQPCARSRVCKLEASRPALSVQAVPVEETERDIAGFLNLREQHGYTYGASSQFSFRRAAGPS